MDYLVIREDGTLERVTQQPGQATLKVLQEAVEGLIEAITLMQAPEVEVVMWVNEEGLMNGMKPNFPASWLVQTQTGVGTLVHGPVIIAGTLLEGDRDTVGCPVDYMEEVKRTWRQDEF